MSGDLKQQSPKSSAIWLVGARMTELQLKAQELDVAIRRALEYKDELGGQTRRALDHTMLLSRDVQNGMIAGRKWLAEDLIMDQLEESS